MFFFQRSYILNTIPKIHVKKLQNCGDQGLKTQFSNTPLSLQVAMRAISKNTNDAFSKGLCVYQNTNSSGPQESIFQHLLEPEAGPEGGNRKYK